MLKFLIIQLDDSSVSFCHYPNDRLTCSLIPLDILEKAIFWSMKENLTLQFVYPDYELPQEYKAVISKTYHADIVASTCEDEHLRTNADIVVFDTWACIQIYPFNKEQTYVLRTSLKDLYEKKVLLNAIIPKVNRLNIVLTDIMEFTKDKESIYALCLDYISNKVLQEMGSSHMIQINVLTDRILLDKMNNCGAGEESVTLCPDGNFYVCPAFYYDNENRCDIGNIHEGLDVKNPQLYRLEHAPICRICDAYQCRRCIWLNKKTTLEVNTPSHEQCVVAHIERNASKNLLSKIKEIGQFRNIKEIPEIDYLDPFEKLQQES